MTWLSKLFNRSSDKIEVSNDGKESSGNKSRKKSNRNRSNSLVMRQKMQKKIAESAKERVLDKRRSQRPLESIFEANDSSEHRSVNEAAGDLKFDFRKGEQRFKQKNMVIKHMSLIEQNVKSKNLQRNFSSVQVIESDWIISDHSTIKRNDQNGYERKSEPSDKSIKSKVEENQVHNEQSAQNEPIDKENKTSFSGISRKVHQLDYYEQPELFSYRLLNSPNDLVDTLGGKKTSKDQTGESKISRDKMSNISVGQMQTRERTVKSMTEDSCAINELLEGRMDLQVIVPAYLIKNQKVNAHTALVLINIERNTPMLDLLIQIGNKIKFNANDYKIVVADEFRINYKANTPIGSLDVSQIQIVPKTAAAIALDREKLRLLNLANQSSQQKSISTFNKLVQNSNLHSQQTNGHSNNSLNGGSSTIPFQTTFRLQVNLPHNQRMVFRVTPATRIKEVKELVCEEKELNKNKYQLVIFADLKQEQHPQILELERTLAFYAVNEITLISNKNLEKMQMQNEICGFNTLNKLNDSDKLNESLTNSLNSIVNSQSTAASVPRKAIISLLSATNQLEVDCDYSNNICTKNKCVCNLSSTNKNVSVTIKNRQKRTAKSDSSTCLSRIGRRRKAPAPLPPINTKNQLESENLKRSISNNSINIDRQTVNNGESKNKSRQENLPNKITSKQRHNSGSDSSGYHECLSTANSPNSQQFGGSMINLSNNSLTVSPILEHQRLTSTPSSKQYRSTQNLNYKKRRAPSAPFKQLPSINQQPDLIQNNQLKHMTEKREEPVVKNEETNDTSNGEKSNGIKNADNGNQNGIHRLELEKNANYEYSGKQNLKSNPSFKSETSSGHSSGNSSSNSPDLNADKDVSSNSGDNSLEDEVRDNRIHETVSEKSQQNNNEIKLSKLVEENLESRLQNSKSPTSVASEPIYLTPKTYFANQTRANESTSSIVLNLDEVRPCSAPTYFEEEKTDSSSCEEHSITQEIRSDENSKNVDIHSNETITVNKQLVKVNSTFIKENKYNENEVKEDVTIDADSSNGNVTTLIINVNDQSANEQNDEMKQYKDIKSVSTFIENGAIIIKDHTPPKNTSQFFKQAPGSSNNIAPASYAIKSDEIEPVKSEKSEKSDQIAKLDKKSVNEMQPPQSRILNIRNQFEQSKNSNKPKIKLTNKLANFRIGSYSTNHIEEDIYSDNKSSYSLENARQNSSTQINNNKTSFRYLSSPVEMNEKQSKQQSIDELEGINKSSLPIKKPNLNAIKFNEIALNEGLNDVNKQLHIGNKDHNKEIENYNSDEFNDTQELNSFYPNANDNYSTFNYQPDLRIQNLLTNNLSMITPQPYKSTRAAVSRKLFFSRDTVDGKPTNGENLSNNNRSPSTFVKNEINEIADSKIPMPPPLPIQKANNTSISLNRNEDVQKELRKHSSLQSTNSFREEKTRIFLVSDHRKINSNHENSVNNSLPKLNFTDCHDSLMNEIRAFGGKNSLKRVRKDTKEFEIEF